MKETLKLALEALEKHGDAYLGHSDEYQFAITKVKEALAQPEQEPVAMLKLMMEESAFEGRLELSDALLNIEQFYTTPPQRTWVGLTDEDRQAAFESMPDMLDGFLKTWGWLHFSKAIEAKLKEKNT